MDDVLVVEDDVRIASLCARLLARLGLNARTVGTRADALELLARTNEPLALAYVDVGLPDGSGLDVAETARRLRPTLPLMIATGSLADVQAGDAVLLPKPFTLDQFKDAVTKALAWTPSPGPGPGLGVTPPSAP